jgi:hypothetical protein
MTLRIDREASPQSEAHGRRFKVPGSTFNWLRNLEPLNFEH